jgi:hypothetical protein
MLERGVAAAGTVDVFGMAMRRMVGHGSLRLKKGLDEMLIVEWHRCKIFLFENDCILHYIST